MNTYSPYGNYYQNYPNYQQQVQQPVQQMPQPIQVPNQILAWVKDENEAVNFPLNIGQSIFLMNQTEPYLYSKSVDQLGKVTFVKKRLVDEGGNKEEEQLKDFIKREELDNLISDRIREEIEKKMSEISFKPTKTKKPIEEE